MTQSTRQLPVRKLCSCNAVLCSPEEAKTAPDTELFGVLLLNSPANTEADFAEYVRLYRLYRGGGGTEGDAVPKNKKGEDYSPYFICADGAYAGLKQYCAAHCTESDAAAAAAAAAPTKPANGKPSGANSAMDAEKGYAQATTTHAPDRSAIMAMQLCDVLIGDMDSISLTQLRRVAAVAAAAEDMRASSPTTTQSSPQLHEGEAASFYHETVAAIPVPLLEVIRRRRDEAVRRRHQPATPAHAKTVPVVLPIACQMSTDFHKGVALLERLRRLEQGNTESLSEEQQAAYYLAHQEPCEVAELMATCDAEWETACEESARQAGEDAQEAARCRQLINSVSPSTSSAVRTQVLPNVAVFGALGGRIDHEIGAMVCVMRFARIFHLLVVNSYNVLFACWPDGVTQLLMPPSWTQQANLSKDPSVQLTASAAPTTTTVEPYMNGVVQFGVLREMETTGCLWNVVKGRRDCYDGFTHTNECRFAFDDLISVCNSITSRLVTVDLRPLNCDTSNPAWDPAAPSVNPPTLFLLGRLKSTRSKLPAKEDALSKASF
ncbi:hypothetical protein N2W54_002427 [Lotmaria passim]